MNSLPFDFKRILEGVGLLFPPVTRIFSLFLTVDKYLASYSTQFSSSKYLFAYRSFKGIRLTYSLTSTHNKLSLFAYFCCVFHLNRRYLTRGDLSSLTNLTFCSRKRTVYFRKWWNTQANIWRQTYMKWRASHSF